MLSTGASTTGDLSHESYGRHAFLDSQSLHMVQREGVRGPEDLGGFQSWGLTRPMESIPTAMPHVQRSVPSSVPPTPPHITGHTRLMPLPVHPHVTSPTSATPSPTKPAGHFQIHPQYDVTDDITRPMHVKEEKKTCVVQEDVRAKNARIRKINRSVDSLVRDCVSLQPFPRGRNDKARESAVGTPCKSCPKCKEHDAKREAEKARRDNEEALRMQASGFQGKVKRGKSKYRRRGSPHCEHRRVVDRTVRLHKMMRSSQGFVESHRVKAVWYTVSMTDMNKLCFPTEWQSWLSSERHSHCEHVHLISAINKEAQVRMVWNPVGFFDRLEAETHWKETCESIQRGKVEPLKPQPQEQTAPWTSTSPTSTSSTSYAEFDGEDAVREMVYICCKADGHSCEVDKKTIAKNSGGIFDQKTWTYAEPPGLVPPLPADLQAMAEPSQRKRGGSSTTTSRKPQKRRPEAGVMSKITQLVYEEPLRNEDMVDTSLSALTAASHMVSTSTTTATAQTMMHYGSHDLRGHLSRSYLSSQTPSTSTTYTQHSFQGNSGSLFQLMEQQRSQPPAHHVNIDNMGIGGFLDQRSPQMPTLPSDEILAEDRMLSNLFQTF